MYMGELNKKRRLNSVNFKVQGEFFTKRSPKSEKNKIIFLQFLRALADNLLNNLQFFYGQYKLVITGKLFTLQNGGTFGQENCRNEVFKKMGKSQKILKCDFFLLCAF